MTLVVSISQERVNFRVEFLLDFEPFHTIFEAFCDALFSFLAVKRGSWVSSEVNEIDFRQSLPKDPLFSAPLCFPSSYSRSAFP